MSQLSTKNDNLLFSNNRAQRLVKIISKYVHFTVRILNLHGLKINNNIIKIR